MRQNTAKNDAVKSTVTMVDVAREAGVSVASVSNYLNKRPYMSDQLRRRIAKALEETGYQVNISARNLRSGRTRLLKLAVPNLRQLYFAELAEDVLTEARKRGYGVIVESTTNDRDREIATIRSMGEHAADGLIISPLALGSSDAALLDGDFPMVVLGESMFGARAPHVMISNRVGAYLATQHLIEAGCRRIAVVGGLKEPDHAMTTSRAIRTRGYRDALYEAGLPFDPDLVIETEEWTSFDGSAAASTLMDSNLQFDAVFALNDLMAWGVMHGLRDFGLMVPDDVRVVGFDDLDESRVTTPSLTTIDPHRPDIARLAVESIIAQIEAGSRGAGDTLVAPISLVCRESSPAV
ncbi:LacI family DNA-binding transcriptional regulator [Bifidobacterium leontopitheci]|uniref:LacI family transcriptional regulator n=1 Tax=Bifidobacterium leontopitheci TaxID=2650774 RepID=A0A6I1GJ53_9BIFI|nr:LacI family DNA-binding transcriptional regulator [Bifidobacterium leontopitheci]KAB7789656.1 LacI family transcriptional regulator [Bifidobacterium leontopitheci]